MISDVKDVANIIFFIVVATITILSYKQARKTLFSPIRTEVFKLQIKIFEEVLAIFQNKNESDFLKACDFDRICKLNAYQMVDAYVQTFFSTELEVDKVKQKEMYGVLTRGMISAKHAEKYLRPLNEGSSEDESDFDAEKITSPALLLSKWRKYEHSMIGFTDVLSEFQAEVTRLSISPILPVKIRSLVNEFNGLVTGNLMVIGETITEYSQKMPEVASRASDMGKFNVALVSNSFNSKRSQLEPKAREILDSINDYLKVEEIMK